METFISMRSQTKIKSEPTINSKDSRIPDELFALKSDNTQFKFLTDLNERKKSKTFQEIKNNCNYNQFSVSKNNNEEEKELSVSSNGHLPTLIKNYSFELKSHLFPEKINTIQDNMANDLTKPEVSGNENFPNESLPPEKEAKEEESFTQKTLNNVLESDTFKDKVFINKWFIMDV